MRERLEEIKYKALHRKREAEAALPYSDGGIKCREDYAEDVSYVLQRVEEQEKALAELSRRIYLQRKGSRMPWLAEWQEICDEALHVDSQRSDLTAAWTEGAMRRADARREERED